MHNETSPLQNHQRRHQIRQLRFLHSLHPSTFFFGRTVYRKHCVCSRIYKGNTEDVAASPVLILMQWKAYETD